MWETFCSGVFSHGMKEKQINVHPRMFQTTIEGMLHASLYNNRKFTLKIFKL
jgi:hypothetical protein